MWGFEKKNFKNNLKCLKQVFKQIKLYNFVVKYILPNRLLANSLADNLTSRQNYQRNITVIILSTYLLFVLYNGMEMNIIFYFQLEYVDSEAKNTKKIKLAYLKKVKLFFKTFFVVMDQVYDMILIISLFLWKKYWFASIFLVVDLLPAVFIMWHKFRYFFKFSFFNLFFQLYSSYVCCPLEFNV